MSKKKNKSKKRKISLNVINLILVIISISISFYAIISNEKIAVNSGAFDKGIFNLEYGGYGLHDDTKYDVYFGVEISETKLNFSTLPITVNNVGQKTLKNINLIYQYPLESHISISDSIFKLTAPLIEGFRRKETKSPPYQQIAFHIDNINPNFPHKIGDLISINTETILNHTTPVVTADSVALEIMSEVIYSIPTQISISAENVKSKLFNLNINFRKETNLNSLIDLIIQEKLSQREKKDFIPNFFITIPEKEQSKSINKIEFNILKGNDSNTLFFQFDKSRESLALVRPNGKFEIIDIKK